MNNRERVDVVIGEKKKVRGQQLPSDVALWLVSLPIEERRAYAKALREKGWTLSAIAKPLNLTRESIRLYALSEVSEELQKKIESLPLPDMPKRQIVVSRIKRVPIDPDVVERLKQLHDKAKLVRGKGKNYREEAEQFTRLVWEQTQLGVTLYSLAKAIGVSHGGLQFRLVRYGYKTTNGQSKVYKPMKHRSNNA